VGVEDHQVDHFSLGKTKEGETGIKKMLLSRPHKLGLDSKESFFSP
jgi:hypothetical protein